MDKIIAQKWLDACDKYEKSWDGNKYTSKKYDDLFIESLTEEEKRTGFALVLSIFGWQWWNDAMDICNCILK